MLIDINHIKGHVIANFPNQTDPGAIGFFVINVFSIGVISGYAANGLLKAGLVDPAVIIGPVGDHSDGQAVLDKRHIDAA